MKKTFLKIDICQKKPLDKELYERLKKEIWEQYKVPSAYRSAQLVKRYKEAGGTYSGKKDDNQGIKRWMNEAWKNQRGEVGYKFKSDVYRPTVRINSKTPKTFQELTTKEIERARREKAKDNRVDKFKK